MIYLIFKNEIKAFKILEEKKDCYIIWTGDHKKSISKTYEGLYTNLKTALKNIFNYIR